MEKDNNSRNPTRKPSQHSITPHRRRRQTAVTHPKPFSSTTPPSTKIRILPQSPQMTQIKSTYDHHRSCKRQRSQRNKLVRCWAHTKNGARCSNTVRSREGEPVPVPYCEVHMKSGDGAVKVVNHKIVGNCLVARFDLPPKYRLAYWGRRGRCLPSDEEDRAISFYPPDKITGRNTTKDGTRITNYNGVLNPGGTGDLIQYAACPGPNERQNMRSTAQYWGLRNGCTGGLEFVTLESVPKNTQLCHWYGPGWWSARGVRRMDVGTKRHPAPRRIGKKRE